MPRKIIIYSLYAWILISTISCNKWLTVNPKNQTSEANQFNNEQGFIDVLWGAYQKMAASSAYGLNQSFGFVDVMAQYYSGKTGLADFYGRAARYDFSSNAPFNVQEVIDSIWKADYSAIAQVNYVLKNIDGHSPVFTGDNYNLIKGEAYAMRAYLHFDLLRLFAPAPGINPDAAGIPYMKDFTIRPQSKSTVAQVIKECVQDLQQAKTLLVKDQDIDQISQNQGSTASDLTGIYRQNHLNYWAVNGELARIYLYNNQKDSALYYAQKVIESGKFSFVAATDIQSDPSSVDADLTFSREHLFSLYNSKGKNIADQYFKSTTGSSADIGDLYSTVASLNALYEVTTAGYGADVRGLGASKSLWNQLSSTIVYTKKYWFDNSFNVREGLIPMIRLSEMYYIAAESSASAAEGVTYLNKVRLARLLPPLDSDIDGENLDKEIGKEYKKEFYGEGQLWYYYKRKNILTIDNLPEGNTISEGSFVLPFPQDEIEFGL